LNQSRVEHDGFVHELNIPDELLAWGEDPKVFRRWIDKGLVADIRRFALAAAEAPLEPADTERLLASLESLCREAAAAKRVDLLMGLDMATAEWLDLTIAAPSTDGGEIAIGRGGQFSFQEMRAILASSDPAKAAAVTKQTKQLLEAAGWGGQLHTEVKVDSDPIVCESCAQPMGSVIIHTHGGGAYCGRCWSDMTSPMPTHLQKIAAAAARTKAK